MLNSLAYESVMICNNAKHRTHRSHISSGMALVVHPRQPLPRHIPENADCVVFLKNTESLIERRSLGWTEDAEDGQYVGWTLHQLTDNQEECWAVTHRDIGVWSVT